MKKKTPTKRLPNPVYESFVIGLATHELKFDWENSKQVLKKVKEEFQEMKAAYTKKDSTNLQEEIGDLFFALSQFARHNQIDPEVAFAQANKKFLDRFSLLLQICGEKKLDYFALSIDEKEELWKLAKKRIKSKVKI